jgi:hypothetical protein
VSSLSFWAHASQGLFNDLSIQTAILHRFTHFQIGIAFFDLSIGFDLSIFLQFAGPNEEETT